MYSLDIETLISVLQNRRIQGFLEADLSTGGGSGSLKSGFVKIELKDGKIITASISDANGRIFYQGQDALNKVRRLVLTWQLTEMPSTLPDEEMRTSSAFPGQQFPTLNRMQPGIHSHLPSVDRSSASDANNFVPVRWQNPSPDRLRSLSRSARSIYALVNGTNSIRRIAGLLSQPVGVVYRELLALQEGQLIVIRDDSRTS